MPAPDTTYAPGDRCEMVCTKSTLHGTVIETDASRKTVLVEWDEVPGSVTEYLTDRRPGDFVLRRVGA
jgi:hypothetical protein